MGGSQRSIRLASSAGGRIEGTAYGRPATLDVTADTLTWRATRGFTPVAENIVTTVHDVRFAHYTELRHSWGGLAIGVLAILWMITEGLAIGAIALAVALALLAWRFLYPQRYLVLDVGTTRLVLKVAAKSGGAARMLADRIDRALATGEAPATPPMLP